MWIPAGSVLLPPLSPLVAPACAALGLPLTWVGVPKRGLALLSVALRGISGLSMAWCGFGVVSVSWRASTFTPRIGNSHAKSR